jgi:diaminopimelate epimerase
VGDWAVVSTVSLLKYQALGNDFLIGLDPPGISGPGAVERGLVEWLCDRRRGVGADGLILVRPARSGGDVAMELYNSDGGRAETSGNGLRCLALCLIDAGVVSSRAITIETDGGPVEATVGPQRAGAETEVSVSMGTAKVFELPDSPLSGFLARHVEVGNPHLVLIGDDLRGIELGQIGPKLEQAVDGGQNIELVTQVGPGALRLSVWERGAGLTMACGSGSVAAAAAARAEKMVGDEVTVENPGGVLVVSLSGPVEAASAVLRGPACRVARIEVELGEGFLR